MAILLCNEARFFGSDCLQAASMNVPFIAAIVVAMNTFIPLTVIAVVNFVLAAIVFFNRPRQESNRVFSVTAFAVAVWSLTNGLFQNAGTVETATLWAQLSYAAGIITAASFLHFAWIYPQPMRLSRYAKVGLWLVALSVSLSPFVSGLVIRSVTLDGHRLIVTGSGVFIIAAFMFITTASAFLNFYRGYPLLHRIEREQLHYVLFGSIVTALCGLTFNLLLPLADNYDFVWIGPASSLVFVGSTVYAIITRRLLDVRIVIKRTLVYSLLLAGIAGSFSLLELLLTEIIKWFPLGEKYLPETNIAAAMLVSLLTSLSKGWLEKAANRLVFGRRYKPQHQHDIR